MTCEGIEVLLAVPLVLWCMGYTLRTIWRDAHRDDPLTYMMTGESTGKQEPPHAA